MRALLAVSVFVVAGLSGCLTDGTDDTGLPDVGELSQKIYDVLPVEIDWAASTIDGKRLHNAVYRPDTDEPVPVWINFSPYWGDSAEAGGDNFAQYMINEYVPRGYAVVLAAVRGTGHSEGCFQIAGDLEIQDAYDTVEHFASQNWSNGNVGVGGKSYDSTTQNGMIAKNPHPAVKAAFHVSGITDMYRYNYREGMAYGHGTSFNTYYYLQGVDEYGLGLYTPGSLDGEDSESLARVIDDAACTELPQMQASGIGSGVHGLKDEYWIERDWNRYIADSTWEGGLFFVHGLQDWNVKPDHIMPWLDLLPAGVEVTAWLHQWQQEDTGHVYPMRDDWNQTMLTWMDHWLKGADVVAPSGFEVQGSDGLWRSSEAWPAPAHTVAVDLEDLEVAGTMMRPEFVGPVAEGGVRIVGSPVVYVNATSTSADPVITAVLYEEIEGERRWVNEAVLRGIYRDGLESPTPVPIGGAVAYRLEFYPMDHVVPAGASLVVVLGGDPEMVGRDRSIGLTYDLGGATMHLPQATTEADAVQPAEIFCFAC